MRVGDPDPGRDREEPMRLGHAGDAEVDRQLEALCPPRVEPRARSPPGRSTAGSSCSWRRRLGAERLEERAVGDERVALRVAGDADLGERMADLGHRPEERQAVGEVARLLGVAADDERPVAPRPLRARRAGRARWARSRIIRAERWGTARKPAAWSCSQRSTVASIPLAGDAVTETVAPAGRAAAWSIAFLSGMSSNVGSRRRARIARPGIDRKPRVAPEEHRLRLPSREGRPCAGR